MCTLVVSPEEGGAIGTGVGAEAGVGAGAGTT